MKIEDKKQSHLLPLKHFSLSSFLKRGLSGVTLILSGSIGAPPITVGRLLPVDFGTMVGLPSSRSRSIIVLFGRIQRTAFSRRDAKSLILTLFCTRYINPSDPWVQKDGIKSQRRTMGKIHVGTDILPVSVINHRGHHHGSELCRTVLIEKKKRISENWAMMFAKCKNVESKKGLKQDATTSLSETTFQTRGRKSSNQKGHLIEVWSQALLQTSRA